jgi:1,3-beta-glucanosyltransferase GAS1
VLIVAYHVDPTQNHDACMQAFAQNGIYIFLDIDTFTTQIYQTSPMWNATMFADFAAVIDNFAVYDNIAGFFMANEVPPPS